MIQINLDCEGPLTLNDNAFELCQTFIPQGDKFFSLISKYDDYLADIEKRKGYKAGDTLRLILPFLVSYGVTNRIAKDFSRKTLKFLSGAEALLRYLSKKFPTFIISTSYRPYLEALCETTDFPFSQVFCTEVDFDRYRPSPKETSLLHKLLEEIVSFPMLLLPTEAQRKEDLSSESQRVIERLDEIFWEIIPSLKTGRFLEEVKPIGGVEKAKALEESLVHTNLSKEEVLYVGDSITDVEAFKLVKKGQGGSISFNGNFYALKAAEFYCLAPQAKFIACLGEIFKEGGRDSLYMTSQKQDFLLCKNLEDTLPLYYKGVEFGLISSETLEEVIEKSLDMRKKVRGEAIGALG